VRLDKRRKKMEDDMCKTCPHAFDCYKREAEPHILEAQHLYCHEEVGNPSFEDDNYWVNKMVAELL